MSTCRVSAERLSRREFVGAAVVGLTALTSGCAMFNKPKTLDPSEYMEPVKKTVAQVLDQLKRAPNFDKENKKKPVVCFIGVIGPSSEDVSKAARAQLQKSEDIKVIEKAKMTAALKSADIRASEVFIPVKRKKFAAELGESFDYLLSGYVEDVEEHVDPNDDNSKTYTKTVFRLSLVDLDTNRTYDFTNDL